MRTNHNFDTFVYFGVILDRSIAHELAVMNGFSTIYDFVEAHNLSYQMVGDVHFSDVMVVGEQMHWDYGSHITEISDSLNLKSKVYSEDQEYQYENKMNFDCEDIEKKLKGLGVSETPKHYIITNHGKM